MERRQFITAGLGLALAGAVPFAARPARAQADGDVLRIVAETALNSQDPHGAGIARGTLGALVNTYDRLVNFGRTALPNGVWRYDYHTFTPELAESYEVLEDGRVLVFHLRRGATFHDGAPVTARDVKWSLDRGVALPTSGRQLSTGSLTDPAQFEVVDDHTLRITLPRADRYTLPNLALPFASILNAELVKKHAAAEDPWATAWVQQNAAGGGAFRVVSWQPGQQAVYERFDAWKSGPLPYFRRAVFQTVATPATRAVSLQRGDAGIVLDLPPRDFQALAQDKSVATHSIPVTATFRFVAFNTQQAPFDDVRVRQAIAWALPYRDLLAGANSGQGTPLFGAASAVPDGIDFPQPYPYDTDLAKAKALLAEAGHAKGFDTTFSFSTADASIAEPASLLVQEALAKVGIRVSIDKIPGAQWGTRQADKSLPFFIDTSSAWFNEPDYFFRIFFQGDWRWNFGSFRNDELAAIVEQARWEPDAQKYREQMRRAIAIAFEQAPLLPLWLPSFNIALKPDLRDFTYYIHGQVDLRVLSRG